MYLSVENRTERNETKRNETKNKIKENREYKQTDNVTQVDKEWLKRSIRYSGVKQVSFSTVRTRLSTRAGGNIDAPCCKVISIRCLVGCANSLIRGDTGLSFLSTLFLSGGHLRLCENIRIFCYVCYSVKPTDESHDE